MQGTSSLILLALCFAGLFAFLPSSIAQTSDAVCLSQFGWTTNSLGQSPCLVNSYVDGACFPDVDWTTKKIPDLTQTYLGPTADTANSCTCSSVAFTLLSACAYCQDAELNTWSSYIENCSTSDVSNGDYSADAIPDETAVPAWAFTPIDAEADEWDPVTAQALAANSIPDTTGSASASSAPETSTGAKKPAATSTKKTGSTPTIASKPTSTGAAARRPTPATTKKKNSGAIIGGTVGGILVAILAAALGFYRKYILRKRKEEADEAQTNQFGTAPSAPADTSYDDKYVPTSAVDPLYPAIQTYDPFKPVQNMGMPTPNLNMTGQMNGFTGFTANLTNNKIFGALSQS